MESNQSLGNASVSTSATVPTSVSKQNTAPQNSEKKKGKGMIYGMILLAILAAGGIGFGVWAWMDGNTRVDVLNEQIRTSKVQDNELLNKIKESEEYEEGTDENVIIDTITNVDVDTNTDTDENMEISTDVDTADYIYVGRWGLKIKVADGLKQVEYALLYGSEDFSRLCVAGLVDRASYSYKFGNLGENFPGLACVIRGPSNYKSKDCESMFSRDDHNYCVLSNYLSKYSHTEDEIQLEKDSMKLVIDMLSDSNNYSEI